MGKKKKKHDDGLPKTPYDRLIKQTRKTIKYLQEALAISLALDSMLTDETKRSDNEVEIEQIKAKLDEAMAEYEGLLNEKIKYLERQFH